MARPKEKEKSPKTEKKKKEKKLKKKAKKKNKKNGVNGDASLGKIDEEEARENVDETTLDDSRLGADSTVADGPSPQVTSTIEVSYNIHFTQTNRNISNVFFFIRDFNFFRSVQLIENSKRCCCFNCY